MLDATDLAAMELHAMRTRDEWTVPSERAFAWLIVLVLHGYLVWLARSEPRVALPTSHDTIQVVFIDRTPQHLPATVLQPGERKRTPQTDDRQRARPQHNAGVVMEPITARATASVAEPPAGRPLAMVYIAQALLSAETAARAQQDATATDPFARRAPTLPGKPGERFRMRNPISAADVVAGIGKLFGGPGYSANPCEDLARSIAALAIQGDSWELRHDMEFEKNNCRR